MTMYLVLKVAQFYLLITAQKNVISDTLKYKICPKNVQVDQGSEFNKLSQTFEKQHYVSIKV